MCLCLLWNVRAESIHATGKCGMSGLPACMWMHVAATQEALVEQYNDQLRELRQAGLTEQAEEVREALRALRDQERAPEASVQVKPSSWFVTACAGL